MINLKAVIPVAGLGMHMLPATKAIPKEMLPIVDKPMIQYIVDEIVAAGIKEIVLVTHSSKNAVENHFDTSYELEALLEQRVKRQLLAEVQSICPPGVTIMNVRQAQPLGLGHSILCARPVVGDNPFIVVLPDIIIDTASADPLRYNLAAMVARFNETGRSQVLAKRMKGDLSEYSVIQTKEPLETEGQVSRIVEFIEKPDQPQTLDSDLMAVGHITEKFHKKSIYIPHPIRLIIANTNEIKSNDLGRVTNVFMPSFVEENLKHKICASFDTLGNKFILRTKGKLSKFKNVSTQEFFYNYDENMLDADAIFIPQKFDYRVSGVLFEALQTDAKIFMSNCLFSKSLKEKFESKIVIVDDWEHYIRNEFINEINNRNGKERINREAFNSVGFKLLQKELLCQK